MAADRHRAYFAADHFRRYCPCSFLLDGQPVMAMFRRSPQSPSPFRHRQEELVRREAELRDQFDKLERMMAKARRATEETSRPARDKAITKTNPGDNRLHVSVALQDKLYGVDVSQVEAAAHAIPIFNVFREDEPRDWFTAEEALSNAPRQANGLFIVTKVVE